MNNRIRIKQLFLTLLLIGNTALLQAQQTFKYRAAINPVDSDGFYTIRLSPLLTARSKTDLSDIRISDSHSKFIPYIFGNRLSESGERIFIPLTEIKQYAQPDSATVFVVKNNSLPIIGQLTLRLRNADVRRSITLLGSDNLQTWYAIKEDMRLIEPVVSSKGIYEQALEFPSSDYHYYKIRIDHKNKEAVSVLQVGTYIYKPVKHGFDAVLVTGFVQKDSARLSCIAIRFAEAYPVRMLHFDISGAKYYKRVARVYELKGKQRNLLTDIEINSKSPDVYLSAKAKAIAVEIMNDDNPPLVITAVKAYQSSQSVISYLNKGQNYYLLSGDEKAIAPQYDLGFFTDSLHHVLPMVNHKMVEANPAYQVKAQTAKPNYTWLLWIAIAMAVLIMGFLTFKMTGEVNKRSAEEH